MASSLEEILQRTSAPETLVSREAVTATFPDRTFTLPSLEGRIRKELSGKLDELFRGIEGHPHQMIILTGLVYELVMLLDAKGLVSVDELSNRFVLEITGKPDGFNVGHSMGQRTYRGLGTDLL